MVHLLFHTCVDNDVSAACDPCIAAVVILFWRYRTARCRFFSCSVDSIQQRTNSTAVDGIRRIVQHMNENISCDLDATVLHRCTAVIVGEIAAYIPGSSLPGACERAQHVTLFPRTRSGVERNLRTVTFARASFSAGASPALVRD